MSVDKTIEELSGTLAQLSTLVEHINGQILGVTSRINMTLDNFDNSVAGIATDASALTGQVGDTVQQIPNSWVFYLLFITLIVVLILLSILIIINLVTKVHAIYRLCFPDPTDSEVNTPLPSNYSESRLLQRYDNSLQRFPKTTRNDISIPIEDARINSTAFPMDSGINPSFQHGFQTGRPNLVINKNKRRKIIRVSVPKIPLSMEDNFYPLFNDFQNYETMSKQSNLQSMNTQANGESMKGNATEEQTYCRSVIKESNGNKSIVDKFHSQNHHQPYIRRPPAASTVASSNFSTQESPSNHRYPPQTYLVSKTEPV